MAAQIVIIGKGNTEVIRQELASRGVRFGMKVGPIEGTPEEFIELLEAGPEIIDTLVDTVQRFGEKISLLVNGKKVQAANKQALSALLLGKLEHRSAFLDSIFKKGR